MHEGATKLCPQAVVSKVRNFLDFTTHPNTICSVVLAEEHAGIYTPKGLCTRYVVKGQVQLELLFFVELVQFKEFLDQTEQLKAHANSSTRPNQMELNQEICSPNQLQGRLKIDFNRPGQTRPVHLPSFEEIARSNPAMEQEGDFKTVRDLSL